MSVWAAGGWGGGGGVQKFPLACLFTLIPVSLLLSCFTSSITSIWLKYSSTLI